jgi:hypothetical protein
MNEIMVNADGTVTVVYEGSVSAILDDLVKANTTPAVYNADGSVKTEAIVPDADTLAQQVTEVNLKTHAWRLPKARAERLETIRSDRNKKLADLDVEYQLADEGVHPDSLSKAEVAAKKQALRDLPPTAESHLEGLNNTDDIAAYDPVS